MSVKTPIRTVFDGESNATGLAEFQTGEFIGLTHGGLGASLSIGSTGQVLKVSSGGALEFGNVEAIVNIDGATNLTGSTLVAGDQILLSDGGTEGRVTLSQIDTLFKDTTQTLTNKTINSDSNTLTLDLSEGTLTGTTAEFNTALSDDSFVTLTGTETLTNKTLTSPVISTISNTGTLTLPTSTGTVALTSDITTTTINNNADNRIITGSGTANTLEAESTFTFDGTDVFIPQYITHDGDTNTKFGFGGADYFQIQVGGFAALEILSNEFNIVGRNVGIRNTDPQEALDVTGNITASGTISGTFTGNITGDVTGNADTATALETARTIAGQSFDGSANITIASTDLSNTSDVVLLTSTQTLTNKTLTSPTITGTGAIAGTFTGNITGDVTGNADTATTLETARTIGGVSFDGSANINLPGVNTSGNQDTSGNADTATTLETARTIAGQSFDGSANITIAATDLSDTDQSLSTTDNVTFNDMTVSGNLTVSGTTTTVNTETINLADNTITLNSNETGTPSQDGGIEIERGTSTNKTLVWNETTDKWTVGSETFVAGTFEGALTGNVTGDVTGNADTATALETARTIGGVSFNGSANIDLPGVNTSGNQDTSGNADTATTLETARTIGGVSFDGSANINLPGVNTSGSQDTSGNAATATALETARTIHGVSFDGTANIDLTEVVQDTVGAMFSSNTETGITVTYQDADGTIDLAVGTLNQNTTGSAATLTTARAFSLTGDVTASGVNFDGSGAVALSTSIAANTVGVSELNVTDGTSGQFLQTNGSGTLSFATVTTPTLASLSLDTTDDVQFDSFGVGTAASGTTGEIRATNDVTAFYSSDVALKEDIVNISNPLAAIEKLNGVLFNWKQSYIDQRGGEDGYFVRRKDVGVIAQDVEKVLPEAVATRPDGVKAVKYDRLTCLLIEAVKALKVEIEELKK